jgi:prepilin-type N-terminal cleavage/methylation domain-containing protein
MSIRGTTRQMAKQGGFTLLEMGIVLGVAAILAAVVLPDFVEAQRNKMAERTAAEMMVIIDAARAFRVANAAGRWPGSPGGDIQCRNDCVPNGGTPQFSRGWFRNDLTSGGFVPEDLNTSGRMLTNPWGQDYEPCVWRNMGAAGGGNQPCMFVVSTNVPRELARMLENQLSQVRCMDRGNPGDIVCPGAGPVPANMVRCCAVVQPPTLSNAVGCPLGMPNFTCQPAGICRCSP